MTQPAPVVQQVPQSQQPPAPTPAPAPVAPNNIQTVTSQWGAHQAQPGSNPWGTTQSASPWGSSGARTQMTSGGAAGFGTQAASSLAQGVKVTGPPGDTVADLEFCQHKPLLAGASWDNTISIWQSSNQFQSAEPVLRIQDSTKDAILRCTWSTSDLTLYYGTARGEVKRLAPDSGASESVGKHIGVVTGLKYGAGHNFVVSGSNDATCVIWDPRKPTPKVCEIELPGKCVRLDCKQNTIAVALSDLKVALIDVRNTSNEPKTLKLRLPKQSQLTSIALGPDPEVIVVGSTFGMVEGRVKSQVGVWHPHKDDMRAQAYPCNCVAVSQYQKGAISGGGDGKLAYINLEKGNLASTKSVKNEGSPITALAMGPNGLYACAVGYDWSKGIDAEERKQPVEIIIKKIQNEF